MLEHFFLLTCIIIAIIYVYFRIEWLIHDTVKTSKKTIIIYGIIFGVIASLLSLYRYESGTEPNFSVSYAVIVIGLLYRGSIVHFISLGIFTIWLYATPFVEMKMSLLHFVAIGMVGYLVYLALRKVPAIWLSIIIISVTKLITFLTLEQFILDFDKSIGIYLIQMGLTILLLGIAMIEIQHLTRSYELSRYYRTRTYLDDLTGADNRLSLQKDLENAHGSLSLVIIDIDHFKRVNDKFGHIRGDQVLLDVTHRINKILEGEGRLYRIGGDEFVILFERISRAEAIRKASKILNNLDVKIDDESLDDPLEVTISVGLASFPHDVDDYTKLYEAADKKMYLSKDAGRNTFNY